MTLLPDKGKETLFHLAGSTVTGVLRKEERLKDTDNAMRVFLRSEYPCIHSLGLPGDVVNE